MYSAYYVYTTGRGGSLYAVVREAVGTFKKKMAVGEGNKRE